MTNGNGRRPKSLDYRPVRDDPERFSTKLSAEEVELIRDKARETVALELKEREEKSLLARFLDEEREALVPASQKHPLVMNLAEHQPYIMLDGVQYVHGQLYYVTEAVAAVLMEQTARGWAHEDDTEVRESSGRRHRRRTRAPDYIGYGNYLDRRQPRDIVTTSAVMESASAAAFGIPRTE